MNTNSNALLNRVEVIFYSILTSCMSAVNRFRYRDEHQLDFPIHSTAVKDELSNIEIQEASDDPFIKIWNTISQAIFPIIIWMILGFAAGFLIGMIRPR